jgi:hypothetical protein
MKAAVALAALLVAAPSQARDVQLEWLAPASFAKEAAGLKINVSPVPVPGPFAIMLTAAPSLDHETLRLGISCSAYKINNPVSAILDMVAREASAPAAPPLRISIATARSMTRCVEVKEYNVRCITRVTLNGEAVVPASEGQTERSLPLTLTLERDSSVGGFCENTAKGVGLVTREAAQQLVAAAITGASAPPATPPVSAQP